MKSYKVTYWDASNNVVPTHAESTTATLDLYEDGVCEHGAVVEIVTHMEDSRVVFTEAQIDVILGACHRTLDMSTNHFDARPRVALIRAYRNKTGCGISEAKEYGDVKGGFKNMLQALEKLKKREYTPEVLQEAVAEFGYPSQCRVLRLQMQLLADNASKEAALFWLSSDSTNLPSDVCRVISNYIISLRNPRDFIGDDTMFDLVLEVLEDEC